MVNLLRHWWLVTVHKVWVLWFLFKFSCRLMWRGFKHDFSKYGFAEALPFARVTQKLRSTTYGSKEYKANMNSILPAIRHHWKRNSHHPEFYKHGINDMNLADIIEMWCDWNASIKKHADGNIKTSLKANRKRFKINRQLYSILNNEIAQ